MYINDGESMHFRNAKEQIDLYSMLNNNLFRNYS